MKTVVKEYLASIALLVDSLVIKSSISALMMNQDLVNRYGPSAVDEEDKYSWKYYMNLSGDYHPTDSPMNVISLDTLESIEFSRQNLEIHPETRDAYAHGTDYYKELVDRYPDHQLLIQGILTPCDIDYAINADDGTILAYNRSLVEPQEDTLMNDVQSFLYATMQNRDVRAYYLIDELYPAAQFATQVILPLKTEIFNQRQKRCFTVEAHSFHMEQHLGSHLGLDQYFKFFTLKQKLFLYRNAEWLEKNIGKQEIFELLIGRLLTERGIPLSEYSVRHQDRFDDQLYPEMLARRKAINPKVNISNIEYISLSALFNKIHNITYGNPDYLDIHQDSIIQQFAVANSAVTQTKVLESSMIDFSDAIPDPLPNVLFRQLVDFAYHDRYDAMIKFKDTVTSEDRILSAKDCVIYLVYLLLGNIQTPLVNIPILFNRRHRSAVLPTLANCLKNIPENHRTAMRPVVQSILSAQPALKLCHSPTQFFKLNYKIFTEALRHWFMMGREGDAERRGIIEGVTLQLYQDEEINLSESETEASYASWLAERGLPAYNYTQEQADRLILRVFEAATGYTFDETKDLASIQTAMINTLKKFCSYTVVFLKEINTSRIRPAGPTHIRPFDLKMNEEADTFGFIGLDGYDIRSATAAEADLTKDDTNIVEINAVLTEAAFQRYEEISLWDAKDTKEYLKATINNFDGVISVEYSGQSSDARFPGDEQIATLTTEQRTNLFSIYQ